MKLLLIICLVALLLQKAIHVYKTGFSLTIEEVVLFSAIFFAYLLFGQKKE